MLWGSYFVLFFNLITVCIDHITKWFSMLKRWKKRTYLKKTFRILGVGWICAFRWSLFISWLSTGTWEVIWCFCIEIMSCHLLCSKLLLTLPCDVAWGSVFFCQVSEPPWVSSTKGKELSMCGWKSVKDAEKGTVEMLGIGLQSSWGPQTRIALQIRRLFLYSCYQNGLFFQQQGLGKPEQSSPRRHDSWVFSKLCNHCQCFKLSNSSEFVCWLLMEKIKCV